MSFVTLREKVLTFCASHLEDEGIFLSGNEKGPYACGVSPLGGGRH